MMGLGKGSETPAGAFTLPGRKGIEVRGKNPQWGRVLAARPLAV